MLVAQKELEDRYNDVNKAGKTEVYKGKPEKWQVLDKSFDKNLRVETQRNIYDNKYLTRIGGESEIEGVVSEEEEEFIRHPIKSKYYD